MVHALRTVTLVIPDYDEAIAWYTEVLGFSLQEDSDLGKGKRWVVVSPANAATGSSFLLAKAATEQQSKSIGNQTGGRVAFFLQSDDFQSDHARLKKAGVHFLEEPRHEPYGHVAQFTDPWGNKYDLIEYATPSPASAAQPSEPQTNSPVSATNHEAPLASAASHSPPSPASAAQPSLEPLTREAAKPSAAADARSEAQRVAQHSGSYVSNGVSPATKQVPGNRLLRFGFVGVIVPVVSHQAPEIQRILSEHADLIQGRMGLPHLENDTISVITLIVHATPDQLGSLTGRLGRLPGITVKSGLAPLKDEE